MFIFYENIRFCLYTIPTWKKMSHKILAQCSCSLMLNLSIANLPTYIYILYTQSYKLFALSIVSRKSCWSSLCWGSQDSGAKQPNDWLGEAPTGWAGLQ